MKQDMITYVHFFVLKYLFNNNKNVNQKIYTETG